jgi:hypothetical protein
MKVLSVYDVLLAEPLVGMNIFDAVHLDNADKVYPVLYMLGININEPIHIYSAYHRTLKGEKKVGYLFTGEIRCDREFINGPYAFQDDYLVSAFTHDRGLYEELHAINTRCNLYGSDNALDENVVVKEDTEYKDDELEIIKQVNQLEEILFHIRGSQQNPDGSFKSLEDYRNPKPVDKKRKKHVHKRRGADEV